MISESLTKGTLHMATQPFEGLEQALMWKDIPANRILVVISVLLFILNIKELFRLASPLSYSFSRARGSIALESNTSNARMRNITALFSVIPFCLMIDRFGLASPGIWEHIPAQYSALATIGLLLAYLLARSLCFFMFRPSKLRSEEEDAIRHSIFNYFILLTAILLLSTGILCLFKSPDRIVRTAILLEIGLIYFMSLLRSGQILSLHCSGFTTFLYLCALELLPTATLVAFVLIF